MREVYEFLKKSGVYYLATLEGDQPRVRPFGTVDIYNDRLYIQTGLVKNVSKQMEKDPKIEICAMNEGRWIRITAEAIRDGDVNAEKHMLAEYPSLADMYKPGDGNTAVYYLKNATAVISSFTEEPRTVKF